MLAESSENDVSSSEGVQVIDVKEYADTNEQECFACGKTGRLNCCQSCVHSFHQGCAKLMKKDNEWRCPDCFAQRPCEFCELNCDNVNKVLCTICRLPSHEGCLQDYHQASRELISSAFLQRRSYVCRACLRKYGVRRIMRIAKFKKHSYLAEEKIIGLVQLNYRSPIHFAFFKEKDIEESFVPFRQRLKSKGFQTNVKNFKESSGFYKQFQIQKLLEIKIPSNYKKLNFKQIRRVILNKEREKYLEFGSPENFSFLVKWKNVDYSYSTWEDEFVIVQLDPQCYHRTTFLNFQMGIPAHRSLSLRALFEERGMTWDESIPYADIIKMSKYHIIYPIHVLEFSLFPKAVTFISYFLAQTSIVEEIKHISIILARSESLQFWKRKLSELNVLLEFVQFEGSEANITTIKLRELKCLSRPKLHVLLVSYQAFIKEQNYFVNCIKEVNFLILEEHRSWVQIARQFRVANTVFLSNISSTGIRSECMSAVHNSFKNRFIFKSDIQWKKVEIIPPQDLTFNSLHHSNSSDYVRYFRIYNVQAEKRYAIVVFMMRFGLPTKDSMQLYPFLRAFDPAVFPLNQLTQQFKQAFKGHMHSLLVLLSLYNDVQVSPTIKSYYFFFVEPGHLMERMLNLANLNVFLRKAEKLYLPAIHLLEESTRKVIGEFTAWNDEDDIILCKLVEEYGCDNWKTILSCKNWSQYSTKGQSPPMNYQTYIKVKCIVHFKTGKADLQDFLSRRIEFIFRHIASL